MALSVWTLILCRYRDIIQQNFAIFTLAARQNLKLHMSMYLHAKFQSLLIKCSVIAFYCAQVFSYLVFLDLRNLSFPSTRYSKNQQLGKKHFQFLSFYYISEFVLVQVQSRIWQYTFKGRHKTQVKVIQVSHSKVYCLNGIVFLPFFFSPSCQHLFQSSQSYCDTFT